MSSRRGEKERTVPKFGSFKPKPAIVAEPEKPEKIQAETCHSSTTKVPNDSRLIKVDRRYHHKQPHSRSSVPQDRKEVLDSSRTSDERRQTVVEPKGDLPFTIDKRGDPLFVRYGSHDSSKVPSYRRSGGGKILGAKGMLDIHFNGTREEFSIRRHHEAGSAFRDKRLHAARAGFTSRPVKRIRLSVDRSQPSISEEFIPFGQPQKRKRESSENDAMSDKEGPSYRSIYGKIKSEDFGDSDSAVESDTSSISAHDDAQFLTPAKKQSMEKSRQVRDHPEDTNSWLELIRLQDDLFRENEAPDHIRTKDETKGLAELKLSMYESALASAPTVAARESLLIGLMREGSRVWKPTALTKRWLEVVDQHRESFALWRMRMDFEQTKLETFTFERIKQLYIDRLRFLEHKLSNNFATPLRDEVADQAVYVFVRLTRFLHDAGFVDLAVGAWQAMLELHFARPVFSEDTRAVAMASFSQYWESEVPRIGEQDATGWRGHGEASNSIVEEPNPKMTGDLNIVDTKDVYKAWASAERQRSSATRMPARIADEGEDDDPYRVVMLSDVEQLLIFFPSALLPHVKSRLVDGFLLFCRLPPAFGTSDIINSALDDPLIYGGSDDLKREVLHYSQLIEMTGKRQKLPAFRQEGPHMALSPEVLFPGFDWFSYLANWQDVYICQDEPVERSFIMNTVRQLSRTFAFADFAQFCLALEWWNDPVGVKKASKALLRQYPSNIDLYNAFALVEWAKGRVESALKVLFSAAQSLASDLATQMLYNTWAWIELDSNGKSQAAICLCSSVGEGVQVKELSPALILKARSYFCERRDYLLSVGTLEAAVQFATSLVLLDYVHSTGQGDEVRVMQGDISAAVAGIAFFSEELSSRNLKHSPIHERFLQFGARLLYFHATKGPFRPNFIREQLITYLTVFPHNTIFLSLLSWVTSSALGIIDDPIRHTLRTIVLASPDASHAPASSYVFAIQHELATGSTHSARLAFEAALVAGRGASSPGLWVAYVRFCQRARELPRALAKEVFYRAVAACPGAKEVYMEAFGTLEMGGAELRAVYGAMEEKGIRVHVELEGFVKRWERSKGGN